MSKIKKKIMKARASKSEIQQLEVKTLLRQNFVAVRTKKCSLITETDLEVTKMRIRLINVQKFFQNFF